MMKIYLEQKLFKQCFKNSDCISSLFVLNFIFARADNENEKFSKQASSHGSLSSITTTSIASSDDPKGRDSGNFDDKGFDRKPSKAVQLPYKQEEWWKTTLQVSIPFLIAGLGTIGAGLILGRVEVSIKYLFF